ncbi:serine/threonine-protein kinase [Clavibacter michiganensis]|uniref:non-specific serine/threonine protein kinase n=2 Tax=Clavibacter michiganensis subsp. insidiosus TaxID=33014 RepID=A0A0D5CJF3_9MICO|nr:serine/threonine-protein kinase [Clavibacter michiganensis]AJW79430.1 protein kinase [Clavibacter michiganensis subsp. insidiosus]AWF97829.1 protein kinase [Clavibacter michiganensis subsp. insidiosus]AWG01971.1 protein kinase [Clavibacter michiganensis subsp. insidiosus]OQJ59533.1 serine/threonine protein kinase [Clavibacter michiganensis subsp. insidiosus]RMC88005.1 serine/threonine protein kinase [Clavibacter michiganensis subsp. insidiosus]
MPGERPDPLAGTLLAGRYRISGLLGRGGMATVYRASDETLGREVAVKVFATDSADPAEVERQEGEVRMLAGLSHPGLVTLFDVGDDVVADRVLAFIVMEIVDGTTLADRMKQGPLPGPEVARIGGILSDALGYIHRRGVVHRDVKPANVLLARPEEDDEPAAAKLTDFGIARLVDGTRLTSTGSIVGTVSYLSPEQALGEEVGAPTDVYALGLVLLECLTGRRTFPGTAAESTMARVVRDPEIPARLGASWVDLLGRMTRRDPATRPTAREVAAELRTGRAPDSAVDAPTATSTRVMPAAAAAAFGAGVAGAGAAAAAPSADRDARTELFAAAPPARGDDPTAAGSPAARPGADRVPAKRRGSRALSIAVVSVLIAAAAVVGVVTVQSLQTQDTSYPSVPGPLGASLEELQKSVEDAP